MRVLKKISYILAVMIITAIISIRSWALPPEIDSYYQKWLNRIANRLVKDGKIHATALRQGFNPVVGNHLNDADNTLTYLETQLSSRYSTALEPFTRLSPQLMEDEYLQFDAWKRFLKIANSDTAKNLEILALQEPASLAAAMHAVSIASQKEASRERRRQIELMHRQTQPIKMYSIWQELDRCATIATASMQPTAQNGEETYPVKVNVGNYEGAAKECEKKAILDLILKARGGYDSASGCESLARVGFSSMPTEDRNRWIAQFGDVELCVSDTELFKQGRYTSFEYKKIPPKFSTWQVWREIVEQKMEQIRQALEEAKTKKSGYVTDLKKQVEASISPNFPATGEFIDSIYLGQMDQPQIDSLIRRMAMDSATAFIKDTCQDGLLMWKQTAYSSLTEEERALLRARLDAICSSVDEITVELAELERQRATYETVFKQGDNARKKWAGVWIGRVEGIKKESLQDSASTGDQLGGLSPIVALKGDPNNGK